MADSTPTPDPRAPARLILLAVACTGIFALGSGGLAASARADGDPASDVLASQTLFLPQDAGVSARGQAQLAALLSAAQHAGYQIRVAMIASPADLGSVTELWHQPQNYARFLAQELSLVYRGTLLVAMPNGYGLVRLDGGFGPERSALAGVSAPGAALETATVGAVQRVTASSGHILALPSIAAPSAGGHTNALAWIVFAAGSALILMAWTASLRARPVHPRGTRDTPT